MAEKSGKYRPYVQSRHLGRGRARRQPTPSVLVLPKRATPRAPIPKDDPVLASDEVHLQIFVAFVSVSSKLPAVATLAAQVLVFHRLAAQLARVIGQGVYEMKLNLHDLLYIGSFSALSVERLPCSTIAHGCRSGGRPPFFRAALARILLVSAFFRYDG